MLLHSPPRSSLIERISYPFETLSLPSSQVRSPDGPQATVCVDPASGFQALKSDEILEKYGIVIDIGSPKNKNKNPVAEKTVQELELELLKQDPSGSPVDQAALAIVTARLNLRIRSRGLSALEMFTQRNQFSNTQITMSVKSSSPPNRPPKTSTTPSAKSPRLTVSHDGQPRQFIQAILSTYNKTSTNILPVHVTLLCLQP